MEDMNNSIDKYFRKRLTSFEQSPPEATWNKIARQLNQKKKKRLVPFIVRIAAGMALLLSIGIGYYWLNNPSEKAEETIAAVLNTEKPADVPVEKNTVQPSVDKVTSKKTTPEFISSPSRKIQESSVLTLSEEPSHEQNRKTIWAVHIPADTLADRHRDNVLMNPVHQRESLILARINHSGKPYLIPDNIPSTLTVKHQEPSVSLTPEEATALLLAEYFDEEPTAPKEHHWILGSEVAPLYSHRSISSDEMEQYELDNLNENESGLLAYAGGIRIAFSTGKRLSILSGFYYSRYGQEKKKVETLNSKYSTLNTARVNSKKYISVTNSTGNITLENTDTDENDMLFASNTRISSESTSTYGITSTDELHDYLYDEIDVTVTQYFDYLEIPLMVKYKVIDRKIDFNFSGGLITNILIGNSVHMIQDGENTRIGETSNINSVNYQGSFGMGVEYPISSGFAFTIEPRFRYYLNPIDKTSDIDVHPFSFGFFAGINYLF